MQPVYKYAAIYVSTVDGDTVTLNVSLGFKVWFNKQKIRLARLNAPESKGPDAAKAAEAKKFLESRLSTAKAIVIETCKSEEDKYGRILAEIFYAPAGTKELIEKEGEWKNINDELIAAGLAKSWDGSGSKPV
jgi:micrococcal nuclease